MLESVFGAKDQRDTYAPSPITGQDRDGEQAAVDANKAKSVLIITGNDVEDLEFFYPYYRFCEEGFTVDVCTLDGGELKGKHGLSLKHTTPLSAVDAATYSLLYLPGGKAPEKLKKEKSVQECVRRFVQTGRPVAAICHGPQILAAAEVIRGKRIAAWPEVEKEVAAAGATYVNEATVRDGQFITARWPGDLPSHLRAVLAVLKAQKGAPNAVAA